MSRYIYNTVSTTSTTERYKIKHLDIFCLQIYKELTMVQKKMVSL